MVRYAKDFTDQEKNNIKYRAYYFRAVSYTFLLEFNLAIKDYTEVLNHTTIYCVAWLGRSRCYDSLGVHSAALSDLKEYEKCKK